MSGVLPTKEAIWTLLSSDHILTEMLHHGADGVYERSGPQEAVYPICVYFKSTSVPEYDFRGHYDEEVWTIKGVDRGDSSVNSSAIADRIEALCHGHALTIVGHDVLYFEKEQDVDYGEVEKGAIIHHTGATYRLCKEPS
jgi:hypothetical protein